MPFFYFCAFFLFFKQDIRIRQRRHKVFENGENIKFIVYDED